MSNDSHKARVIEEKQGRQRTRHGQQGVRIPPKYQRLLLPQGRNGFVEPAMPLA
jgi:hypothetical protein